MRLLEKLNSEYGTYRGLIRLILAQAERVTGRLKPYQEVDMRRVERIVFVCLGNICRSPYAELIAREIDIPTASFGLSTTTGKPAYLDAIRTAALNNRDLTGHITTDISDFRIKDSDLLLVMEIRQADRLKQHLKNSKAQISLLGLWSNPPRPHIHDPMTLSNSYFLTCYKVIEKSVNNLSKSLKI